MKRRDVNVGTIYAVKVGEALAPVRLDRLDPFSDGWIGLNLRSGREVRIRTAQRLRYEVEERVVCAEHDEATGRACGLAYGREGCFRHGAGETLTRWTKKEAG